ncbi:hypothetical protein GCM10009654_60620 [Streptomyces hebeiensis]|uniref:PepSY domain-containing protein n=1 Tax=Streptomyces hebeiensis TaxID=229486 RepID=A0ABN1V669_9ACTN
MRKVPGSVGGPRGPSRGPRATRHGAPRGRRAALGTGLADAGEEAPAQNSSAGVAETKAAAGSPQVTNAAQAADVVLRELGGGRVTGVALEEENGRAVWKVVLVRDSTLPPCRAAHRPRGASPLL